MRVSGTRRKIPGRMKSYKVRVVATKTMWVTQDDIEEDCLLGRFPISAPQLDENVAIDLCKGALIEEMQNNPNRGSAKILAIFDHDTKRLKYPSK